SARVRRQKIELSHQCADALVKPRASHATSPVACQPGDSPLNMRGERRLLRMSQVREISLRPNDANRSPPGIEQIEDVCFTEFDPHRTAPRSLGIVALAVLIDAAESDFQGHTKTRPSANLLKRRTDDTNEMPFVLTTEVGFDFPAIVRGVHGIENR